MSVVFSKPEKRSHWEEMFTEAKQKLISSIERCQIPEFIASVPIRKTRAGLQFTCAAPTLSAQKDVWVCNSDGYVGQVCVLSLNQLEPTVTSCNGVCNSRILCVTSVPRYSETPEASIKFNNFNSCTNMSSEDNRSSLLSVSNSSTLSSTQTMRARSVQSDSNIQLDSSSSSESESEVPDRSISPSAFSSTSNHQPCDESESQMWLGTEDGYIHVYNCSDNIRIKKNKIRIQHASAVTAILYQDNRIFVSLANGDLCVYTRENYTWNIHNPTVLSIGSVTYPVTKLLNVHGKLWCSIQGFVKILNTTTLKVSSLAAF
jgi:Rho guanine nucleotide exchange factor 17